MKDSDLNQIRRRLEQSSGPQYWRSLEELAGSEDFSEFLEHEFPRLAPLWHEPVDRRSVLKLMGASMALAGLAGCTPRQPQENIVPYVRMPEYVVPGNSNYYATTLARGGEVLGVLAETREGRPIKIEGNPDHPASLGATDLFAQAAVLELYDPDRSQTVQRHGQPSSYASFLQAMAELREQLGDGEGLAFLSPPLHSPSTEARLEQLLQRYPKARWYVHDPARSDQPHRGAELAYGEAVETIYALDRAQVVFSLDSDFMFLPPGRVRYAHDFMQGRRLRDGAERVNRLYMAETTPTITGTVADHHHAMSSAEVEALARHLAARLGLPVEAAGEPPVPAYWLQALAEDLQAHRGHAPVLAGEHLPAAVHALVHAINAHLGNVGRTIEYLPAQHPRRARPFQELLREMDAGRVRGLVIVGGNPAYTAAADQHFDERLRRVPLRIHYGLYFDETAYLCQWHVPAAHELEQWSDARAFNGVLSIVQPAIRPLHGGRSPLEFLAAFDAEPERSGYQLLRDYWRGRPEVDGPFEAWWQRVLHDGVIPHSRPEPARVSLRGDWHQRLSAPSQAGSALALELQFRPDPSVWDGRYANNGWLQELPKPLTKLTWGNALMISPRLAEERGLRTGQVVRLRSHGHEIGAPVWVLPGQAHGVLTLHLGYGRQRSGRIGEAVGVNAYALRDSSAPWSTREVELEPQDDWVELANTQHHHAVRGRHLVRTGTLEEYREDPWKLAHPGGPPPEESLYRAWAYEDYAWGMVVDLNACIGCNACVIACQAENNIPVVGPEETRRGHNMHWLRVDRYYEGTPDEPEAVFQPVPCMHCEKAPCEYVCPVHATTHSSEGINEMTYNRCVGTRYCSQNCPYKVRRFNWFDYTGGGEGLEAAVPQHNPEVTVRSRGVMEKCTYCIQRVNRARIEAGREDRAIRDGELQTACQQVCPTRAIVFGDINDDTTAVSQYKARPINYQMLAELNTRPRTSYLARIHNHNDTIARHQPKTEPPRKHETGVQLFKPSPFYKGGTGQE